MGSFEGNLPIIVEQLRKAHDADLQQKKEREGELLAEIEMLKEGVKERDAMIEGKDLQISDLERKLEEKTDQVRKVMAFLGGQPAEVSTAPPVLRPVSPLPTTPPQADESESRPPIRLRINNSLQGMQSSLQESPNEATSMPGPSVPPGEVRNDVGSKPHKCLVDGCGGESISVTGLKRHMYRKHNNGQNQEKSKGEKPKQEKCRGCHKSIRTPLCS